MRRIFAFFCLMLWLPAAYAATLEENLRQGDEALARRDVVAAMTAFTAALEADPRHVKAAYERGRLLLLIGEPSKAVADFTTAILGDPAFGRAYVGRAEAKLALKDGKSAIADFDKAIAVAPGDYEVHVARAAFRLKIGNLGGARADLEAARAVADPATAARLSEILAKLGGE
jgi:tetratricopeptide (TPR) repeat protein